MFTKQVNHRKEKKSIFLLQGMQHPERHRKEHSNRVPPKATLKEPLKVSLTACILLFALSHGISTGYCYTHAVEPHRRQPALFLSGSLPRSDTGHQDQRAATAVKQGSSKILHPWKEKALQRLTDENSGINQSEGSSYRLVALQCCNARK